MKRQFMVGTVFAAALAVGVSAQSSSSSQTPSQGDRQDQKEITVTGCLVSGASDATGTSGTSATSGSGSATGSMQSGNREGGHFILRDATIGQTASAASGSATSSATGTSGSTSGASADLNSYRLVGGQADNLQRYVNHKVEVRGRIDNSMGSGLGAGTGTGAGSATATGTGSATGSATSGTGSATDSMAGMQHDTKMQHLRVISVRDLGTSCTGDQR